MLDGVIVIASVPAFVVVACSMGLNFGSYSWCQPVVVVIVFDWLAAACFVFVTL